MKKLIFTIKSLIEESTNKVTINGNEYINLADLGNILREKSIKLEKPRTFFENHKDDFELYVEEKGLTPVIFVRIRSMRYENSFSENQVKEQITKSIIRIGGKGNKVIRNSGVTALEDWAYLLDINQTLDKLANKARKENWSYSNGKPMFPHHPILYLYLRYTFCRLQYQGKIRYSIDGQWAAWNTGLVDPHYEPIIALFRKNKPGLKSKWAFYEFIIPGESKGKIICNLFTDEIERATYAENNDMDYDETLGTPSLDFEHILKRLNRIPDSFWKIYAPKNFEVRETKNMLHNESVIYYNSLREAIMSDHIAYRQIITAFQNALALAMKRIAWNTRTAVPMYYPKDNRLCLLIPLCLVNDEEEDIALVVKRTAAGKYDGATILTLDMAYADSRVVQCPTSDWLISSKIPGSGDTLI